MNDVNFFSISPTRLALSFLYSSSFFLPACRSASDS